MILMMLDLHIGILQKLRSCPLTSRKHATPNNINGKGVSIFVQGFVHIGSFVPFCARL